MMDDDFLQDAWALSHITSKMPAPPPRPASIASSTRSSKRSSVASSSYRQSRGDLELSEAPPTPSISNLYTGLTLGDELSQSSELTPSTSTNIGTMERSSSLASVPRMPMLRRGSSSTGSNMVTKRRSSRATKEREGPSIVIGVRSPSPGSSPQLSRTSSRLTLSQSDSVSQFYPTTEFQSDDRPRPTIPSTSKVQQVVESAHTFVLDVVKAWYMLLSVIVWPMGWAMMEAVSTIFGSEQGQNADIKGEKASPISTSTNNLGRTFAERFKYAICTSGLLTSNLTISSYERTDSLPTQNDKEEQERGSEVSPSSVPSFRIVSSESSRDSTPSLNLTATGEVLFNATFWAVIVLAPLSKSRQAWIQSTVLLIGLVWGAIACVGIDDQSGDLIFEASHRPTGLYSLQEQDRRIKAEASSKYLSKNLASKTKMNMCKLVIELMQTCKNFDVECNKAIAAVQEVELVSRGFKLTHPLPPISRIEFNASSPPRVRNGSWNSPAAAMNGARLSRSSSSGASASSGWKHHGPRPQSLLFNNGSASPTGRSSPQEADIEPIRMVSLRKLLVNSFEETKEALQVAEREFALLIDEKEFGLLKEMYELHEVVDDSRIRSITPEPWTAPARIGTTTTTTTDKRSSWASLTRSRLDDESSLLSIDDSLITPTTPQRFSLVSDNTALGAGFSSNNRKRDSGMSETWSVASPSRDGFPARSGSRLSYISDKTPLSSTPNQSAATKRLSYVSTVSGTNSPLQQQKSVLAQPTSPAFNTQSNRKRASLLSLGMMEDPRQSASVPSIMNGNKSEAYLIASLKSSFEKMHSIRRRVLCHLLALDFALQQKVSIKTKGGHTSTLAYWTVVGSGIKQLTKTMSSLAAKVKNEVERDMTIGDQEGKLTLAKDRSDLDSGLLVPLNEQHQSTDFTGLEDRLNAMGLALRSVQVKMRSCAEEMKLKSPPVLHGSPSRSTAPIEEASISNTPASPLASRSEKSEKILETVREDLLTLSAEWENALKILRLQRSATPTSAVGDTSSSTINSSRLDSPQEAEEDALRQWVNARKGEDDDDSSDSENERITNKMLESGVLQWMGRKGGNEKGESQNDYLERLLSTATPDHLPPPGLEKVYESMSGVAEAKMQRSGISREERIRLVKEQRAAKTAAATQLNSKPTSLVETNTGIIRELESVMKNRKSISASAPSATASTEKATLVGADTETPTATEKATEVVGLNGLQSPLHLDPSSQDKSKFINNHNIVAEEKREPAGFAF